MSGGMDAFFSGGGDLMSHMLALSEEAATARVEQAYIPAEISPQDPDEPIYMNRACPPDCHGNVPCPNCATKDIEIARLKEDCATLYADMNRIVPEQDAEIATLNKVIAAMAEWASPHGNCDDWDECELERVVCSDKLVWNRCKRSNTDGCKQCIIDHFTRETNDEHTT